MLKYNWVGFYMLEAGANPPYAGAGTLPGSDDSAHPHFVEPGHLRRGGIVGENGGGGRRKEGSTLSGLLARNQVGDRGSDLCARQGGGELDIDSHFLAAFGDEDRELVEYCAQLVGKRLEKASNCPGCQLLAAISKYIV
jgi:hypothetical protein